MRDDDFMLGSWSDDPRIVFLLAEALQGVSAEILSFKISWQAQYLVKLEAASCCSARIANDVSYMMNDEIHFAWQAQYLLSLKGDFTCSAHWK